MLTKRHRLDCAELFAQIAGLINRVCPEYKDTSAEELLFFDIETTGLSANSSFLYLIGCMYLENDNVYLEQFFSEAIPKSPS